MYRRLERGNDQNVPLGTKPISLYTPRTAWTFSVSAELGRGSLTGVYAPARRPAADRGSPDILHRERERMRLGLCIVARLCLRRSAVMRWSQRQTFTLDGLFSE